MDHVLRMLKTWFLSTVGHSGMLNRFTMIYLLVLEGFMNKSLKLNEQIQLDLFFILFSLYVV